MTVSTSIMFISAGVPDLNSAATSGCFGESCAVTDVYRSHTYHTYTKFQDLNTAAMYIWVFYLLESSCH